jgi:uncharacterized protein YqeY
MSLVELINNDIKNAMLAKDVKKLDALRAIKAALLLAKTGKDIRGGKIPDDVEMQILQKLVKQRKESAEIYRSQNRPDLAEIEEFQASIINKYLPEQMPEEEVKKAIQKIIEDTNANSIKEMGKVMGIATKQLAGKTDNKTIAGIVKELLNQ